MRNSHHANLTSQHSTVQHSAAHRSAAEHSIGASDIPFDTLRYSFGLVPNHLVILSTVSLSLSLTFSLAWSDGLAAQGSIQPFIVPSRSSSPPIACFQHAQLNLKCTLLALGRLRLPCFSTITLATNPQHPCNTFWRPSLAHLHALFPRSLSSILDSLSSLTQSRDSARPDSCDHPGQPHPLPPLPAIDIS